MYSAPSLWRKQVLHIILRLIFVQDFILFNLHSTGNLILHFFYREITSLDPKTRTYESVGRMFILTDVSEVKVNLKKRQNTADEKIKLLENNKNYLERNLKDSENNLRDLVNQKKAA